MKRIGFVGLGDMGIGLTNNLLKNKFNVSGFDVRDERIKEFVELGGRPAASCREVGDNSDVVFVMVLNRILHSCSCYAIFIPLVF